MGSNSGTNGDDRVNGGRRSLSGDCLILSSTRRSVIGGGGTFTLHLFGGIASVRSGIVSPVDMSCLVKVLTGNTSKVARRRVLGTVNYRKISIGSLGRLCGTVLLATGGRSGRAAIGVTGCVTMGGGFGLGGGFSRRMDSNCRTNVRDLSFASSGSASHVGN